MDRLRELNAGKRDKHLVGRWCIDQSLTDYSGRGNTATNTGVTTGTTIVGSSRGLVRHFDASDENRIDCGNGSPLAALGAGDFCILAWFRTSVKSDVQTVVSKRNYTPDFEGIQILILTSGYIRGVVDPVSGSAGTLDYSTDVADGKWHHVALTRSGSACALYIDGQSKATATVSGDCSTSLSFKIGWRGAVWTLANYDFMNGEVSDVRAYEKGMSTAEIRELYERTRKPFTPRRRVYSIPAAAPATSAPQLTMLGVG